MANKKKGRKEFQWEAWNLFQMTSYGETHFNVTEPFQRQSKVGWWSVQCRRSLKEFLSIKAKYLHMPFKSSKMLIKVVIESIWRSTGPKKAIVGYPYKPVSDPITALLFLKKKKLTTAMLEKCLKGLQEQQQISGLDLATSSITTPWINDKWPRMLKIRSRWPDLNPEPEDTRPILSHSATGTLFRPFH